MLDGRGAEAGLAFASCRRRLPRDVRRGLGFRKLKVLSARPCKRSTSCSTGVLGAQGRRLPVDQPAAAVHGLLPLPHPHCAHLPRPALRCINPTDLMLPAGLTVLTFSNAHTHHRNAPPYPYMNYKASSWLQLGSCWLLLLPCGRRRCGCRRRSQRGRRGAFHAACCAGGATSPGTPTCCHDF